MSLMDNTPPVAPPTETPPVALTTVTRPPAAELVPANWHLTEKGEGIYNAYNNVTHRNFDCTMEEYNNMFKV